MSLEVFIKNTKENSLGYPSKILCDSPFAWSKRIRFEEKLGIANKEIMQKVKVAWQIAFDIENWYYLLETFSNYKLDNKNIFKMKVNIAIDGPAGSGKTTLGRELAKRINYQFLDSGLFYRYFAKILAGNGYSPSEKEKIIEFCLQKKVIIAKDPQLFFRQLENQQTVLSKPEISNLASLFSPIQELRQIVRELIRELIKDRGFVVVGRDMTFKVLPEAEIKIFLTASQSKRVERRYQQLKKSVKDLSLEEVKKDLIERDKRDEWNIIQAEKAGLKVDNSNLTSAESIEKLYKLYWEKIQEFK